MLDELDTAAQAATQTTGARVRRSEGALPRTAFAQQGGLLAAKLQFEKGQLDKARVSLQWVGEHGTEAEYQTVARLRLARLLLDQKKYDEALKQLDAATSGSSRPWSPIGAATS